MIELDLICGLALGVEFPHLAGEKGFYFIGHLGPLRIVIVSQEYVKEMVDGD